MTRRTSTFPETNPAVGARTEQPSLRHEEALDPATVAELSSRQIARMTRDELARVIRVGRPPTGGLRPEYLDRPTLERLAHLARLCCQRRRS